MNIELPFYGLLDDICKEQNIEKKVLSYDWIIELKKDGKIHHIIDSEFDLNTNNAATIASDKYATYAILKENNIPTIEHRMIFSPYTRTECYDEKLIDEAKALLDIYPKIVVKANCSSKGKENQCFKK